MTKKEKGSAPKTGLLRGEKTKDDRPIPEHLFYLQQLVRSLNLQEQRMLTGTDLAKYDAVVITKPGIDPAILGIEKEIKLNHKPRNEAFKYKGFEVIVYESMPDRIIAKKELTTPEWDRFGVHHHYMLSKIWIYLQSNFDDFMAILTGKASSGQLEHKMNNRTELLKLWEIHGKLSKAKNKHQGIYLPDIYMYSDGSLNLKFPGDPTHPPSPAPGLEMQYMLGYSRETARAFSKLLRDFFQKKIDELEYKLGQSTGSKVKKQKSRFNVDIPGTMSDRIDLVEHILNIEKEKPVKSYAGLRLKKREAGELIILLQAMRKLKRLSKERNIYYLAFSLALLSGRSYHHYYNLLNKSGKVDFKKIFGNESPKFIRKDAEKFADQLSDEIKTIAAGFQ